MRVGGGVVRVCQDIVTRSLCPRGHNLLTGWKREDIMPCQDTIEVHHLFFSCVMLHKLLFGES